MSNKDGLIEIWGKILLKNTKGADRSSFIMAYSDRQIRNLGDAPTFIKAIDTELGAYKLSTFELSSNSSSSEVSIVPVSGRLSSARPLSTKSGIPLCPQCGSQARDLGTHVIRLHTRSTIEQPRRSPTNIRLQSNAHSNPSFYTSARRLIPCPECRSSVQPRNLDRHLRKVHGRN